jgi:DNA repair exonuclease SbcCD ATPase subunit
MKLKKRIKMFEDFASTANTSNSTAPVSKTTDTSVAVDKTNTKSGEAIRTEVIKDVDTILNNLAELSNQITESYEMVNEEGLSIESVMKGIKSSIAIAKCQSLEKKYMEILRMADANLQAVKFGVEKIKVAKALEKQVAKAKDSEQRAKLEKAASDKTADISKQEEYEKTRNANVKTEFETELGQKEENIAKDSPLGKLYFNRKQMLKNQIQEEGVATLAEFKAKQGKDAAAKKLADELKAIKQKANELAKKIADGESDSGEDLKELKGIKAYIKEIEAIQKSAAETKKINQEAEKELATIGESFLFSETLDAILENAVADLFSKAKSAKDEAALAKAKALATALKTAASNDLAAKAALANKIKGQEVPKTIIILAGGDGDSAKEGENGYTLTKFIDKYGGGSDIVGAEEYAPVKAADQVLADVDQAIADAKEDAKGNNNNNDDDNEIELTDEQKAEIRSQIETLEAKIDSGESKKEGKPEDVVAKIEQSLADKRKQVEDLKAQLGESFGSYEQTMAILAEMEASIDKMLEEFDVESVSEEEAVCEKCGEVHEGECAAHEAVTESFSFKSGSVADRFRSLM